MKAQYQSSKTGSILFLNYNEDSHKDREKALKVYQYLINKYDYQCAEHCEDSSDSFYTLCTNRNNTIEDMTWPYQQAKNSL